MKIFFSFFVFFKDENHKSNDLGELHCCIRGGFSLGFSVFMAAMDLDLYTVTQGGYNFGCPLSPFITTFNIFNWVFFLKKKSSCVGAGRLHFKELVK